LPPSKSKVFALGESGLEQELGAENVPFIGGTDPAYRREFDISKDFATIADGSALDPEVGCVLLGLDFHINYLKMSLALAYVQRGAVFLATNTDNTLPAGNSFFPGAGSVGAGIVNAVGRDPTAMGKPSQAMMRAIEGKFQMDKSRTCMIGDKLSTDIQFGVEGGLGGTLMVLTGVSKKEEFLEEDTAVKPSVYLDKLGDLLLAR
jgi:4-nitrophenyl phosphatase